MNLKKLMTNPLPDPLAQVKEMAKKYCYSGEKYKIYNEHAEIDRENYYMVVYWKEPIKESLTGLLIVREDGELLPFEECFEVYKLLTGVDTHLKTILIHIGPYWIQKPQFVWHRLKRLLEKVYPAVERSKNTELERAYQGFLEIPSVMLSTHEEMKEVVERGKKLFSELTTDYLITRDFYDRVDHEHTLLMNLVAKQLRVQIETDQVRREFLNLFQRQIPLWDIINQLRYLRLFQYHRKLKVDKRTYEGYQDIRQDVKRYEANRPLREKQIQSIRNPRS
ncbi:hypothetical protein H2C83_02880 [Thermoactinomyces sp. AMNI-1]|uniref:Uncharacterized protein n=2 Tax=Thermoactinomyces mirandus TaxID=2756294 RepID=A0A7W1XQ81_9BACL|nr:hypothetical protein [Thermoactinomyces mirandus]